MGGVFQTVDAKEHRGIHRHQRDASGRIDARLRLPREFG
jgi:hypothetical protein